MGELHDDKSPLLVSKMTDEIDDENQEKNDVDDKNALKDEIEKLRTKNQQLENRVEALESLLSERDKHLETTGNNNNNNIAKNDTKEIDQLQKRLSALETALSKQETPTGIDTKLKERIINIENVISFSDIKTSKNLKLKWVLQNYEQHFKKGEDVYSPVFDAVMDRYKFQLFIWWGSETEKKDYMGLFLRLHRGDDTTDLLPPFNRRYTLQITDRYNNCKSVMVSGKSLEECREECFTIHEGEMVAREGFGAVKMLVAPYDDFVVNDSLFISCYIRGGDADDADYRTVGVGGDGGAAGGGGCEVM